MTKGGAKSLRADKADRRAALVESVRREWAAAPNIRPTIRTAVGYRVEIEVRSQSEAERVCALLSRLGSDIPELVLAARERTPRPKSPRRTTCLRCGGDLSGDWQRTFCSPGCGNRYRAETGASSARSSVDTDRGSTGGAI